MIQLLPSILLFVLCIFLFFQEVRYDQKRLLEEKRQANAHVLKEVERFLAPQQPKPDTPCGD